MFVELNGEQVANLVKVANANAEEAEERRGAPELAKWWRQVAKQLDEPFTQKERRLVEAPAWAQFFGGRVSADGQPKLVRYEDIKDDWRQS